MRKLLSISDMAFAYLANREYRFTMAEIGAKMGVSQSTISNAIREFEYEMRIRSLENELSNARQRLIELGYTSNTIRIEPIEPN